MSFKSASKFVVRNQVVNPSVLQPMARNASHEPANGSVTCPDHGRSDDTEMIAEIANCRIEYELRPQFKQVYGWFLSEGLCVLMDVFVLPRYRVPDEAASACLPVRPCAVRPPWSLAKAGRLFCGMRKFHSRGRAFGTRIIR